MFDFFNGFERKLEDFENPSAVFCFTKKARWRPWHNREVQKRDHKLHSLENPKMKRDHRQRAYALVEENLGSQGDPTTDSPRDADSR